MEAWRREFLVGLRLKEQPRVLGMFGGRGLSPPGL